MGFMARFLRLLQLAVHFDSGDLSPGEKTQEMEKIQASIVVKTEKRL